MSISMIDLEKLRTFYFCAKTGKFNIAAQELKVDNSTISRQIQALERQFNCDLIERGGFNGLRLTEKGRILYDYTIQIFEKVAQIESSLLHTDEKLQGSLKIWAYNGVALYFLHSHLSEFSNKYPEISLEVISTPDFKDIHLGESDIAIGPSEAIASSIEKSRETIHHLLLSYNLKLYAHKKYVKKYGLPKDVADLKNHRLISAALPATYFPSKVNWYLDLDPQFELRPYLSSNMIILIEKFVKDGLGIGSFSPQSLALFFTKEERENLVEILPEIIGPKCTVSMAYASSLKKSSKVEAFRSFLRKKADSFMEIEAIPMHHYNLETW